MEKLKTSQLNMAYIIKSCCYRLYVALSREGTEH